MESFIRYLYEYKNNQRIRNVGFVKIDQNEEGGTIQIHGRGTFLSNADIKVYLFYLEGNKCRRIPMGGLQQVQSVISFRLTFSWEEVEKYTAREQLKGILLDADDQGSYAAVWDESDVEVDAMTEAVPLDQRPAKEPEEADEKNNEKEAEEVLPEALSYRKIDRGEMTELPRRNWYLANNSFLLHGYYNYHHLLLGEEDGNLYLGVPGIYHRREAVAAQSFGFPEFRQIPKETLALAAQEYEDTPEFGYWCRKIEKE